MEPAPPDDQEIKSKTQLKQEMLARQELGEKLTQLPQSILDKCHLPAELQHALDEYKRIPNKRGARKRQLQFIGKIMRDVDIGPIQQVLIEQGQRAELEKRRFHRLEKLRDELLTGDQAVMNEMIAKCEDLDIQYLRQLIRQADKESKQKKPAAAARKLFSYLKELPGLEDDI